MFLELTGDPQSLNQMYETYEQVTPDDVQRVARQLFTPANRTVVTLLSEKDAAARSTAAAPAPAAQGSAPGNESPSLAGRDVSKQTGGDTAKVATSAPHQAKEQGGGKSPLVTLRVVFRAGSQDDPPGKEGLAALTARLLSEGGSRDVSYSELLEKLYPLAGAHGRSLRQGIDGFHWRGAS